MESLTIEDMKNELKKSGYKNIDEMPPHKIIELWQNQ